MYGPAGMLVKPREERTRRSLSQKEGGPGVFVTSYVSSVPFVFAVLCLFRPALEDQRAIRPAEAEGI